jgi:hypothetical protein
MGILPWVLVAATAAQASPQTAGEAAEGTRPAVRVARTAGPITLDGDLSDPGWQGAATVDTFYETVFGDNRAPNVKTTAWLAYDEKYFYVAVRCQDPVVGRIRAPYVDRDNVFGDQDNFAVFLDTRNDRRSAQEFRVNPRGIQGDAVFNDANGNEDFSPDFYYDTAASVTDEGWQAEMRIPFSSLRYAGKDPSGWGFLLWRNYPRDFRYAIYSSPLSRGANCMICQSGALTGLSGLPTSSHLVVAPYVTAQDVARAETPGLPLDDEPTDFEGGLDVKWSPSADTALDATLNPDFSQVEADVAQVAVNNRFALFFPEKRPFFLEGVDLFDTPLQAVYTRTLTSPRWGMRGTGKAGASSYTVLVTQDRGGGSVILPGPTFSDLAPQDFRSLAAIGRWRRDFGRSFVGALYTGREIDGGGHNRVAGPDFQWRPTEGDAITGQLLLSHTRTPQLPALAEEWDGRTLRARAAHLAWNHRTRTLDWFLRARDLGDGFRADNGYVPQVGIRELLAETGYSFYPTGLFSWLRPYLVGHYVVDQEGDLVNQRFGPGLNLQGKRNLQGFLGINIDRVRTGDRVLSRQQLPFSLQFDPSRRFTRIGLSGFLGEDVDLFGARVGRGGSLTLSAIVRPTDHVDLQLNGALDWLDVERPSPPGRARLFTARVQRLRATYNFSSRAFLRLIGQYVSTRRDPGLYPIVVADRSGDFSGSALFSYRLNWQTALFVGYGDERTLDARADLAQTDRQVFVKLSYSFQR